MTDAFAAMLGLLHRQVGYTASDILQYAPSEFSPVFWSGAVYILKDLSIVKIYTYERILSIHFSPVCVR